MSVVGITIHECSWPFFTCCVYYLPFTGVNYLLLPHFIHSRSLLACMGLYIRSSPICWLTACVWYGLVREHQPKVIILQQPAHSKLFNEWTSETLPLRHWLGLKDLAIIICNIFYFSELGSMGSHQLSRCIAVFPGRCILRHTLCDVAAVGKLQDISSLLQPQGWLQP